MRIKKSIAVMALTLACCGYGFAQWDQVQSMPNPFGGQNFYQGGMPIGQSMPNPFGGLNWNFFRGASGGSVLFASEEVSKKFSESRWIGAVEARNVPAMVECAWWLKGVETMLGKQDKKTTSDAMFDAAAQIAVAQKRADVLVNIVALAPSCHKYLDSLKAEGTARGGVGSGVSMPQLVYPGPIPSGKDLQQWLEKLDGRLLPFETPLLSPDMVQFAFRGISSSDAETVAFLANRGRQGNDAELLAQAAVRIAGRQPAVKLPFLDSTQMLSEATKMALDLGDQNALSQILKLYGNKDLAVYSPEKEKEYSEDLKAMSTLRGSSPGPFIGLMKPNYVHILIFNPEKLPELGGDLK